MNVLEVTTDGTGSGGRGLTGGPITAVPVVATAAAATGCGTGTLLDVTLRAAGADVICSTTFDPANDSSP